MMTFGALPAAAEEIRCIQ